MELRKLFEETNGQYIYIYTYALTLFNYYFQILRILFQMTCTFFSFLQEMEETDEESVLEPEVLVEDEDTETLSGSFSSRLFELEENSVENQNNQETNHNCSAAEALIPAESESEDRVVTVDVASMETETEELQMQEKLELQEKSVGNQVLPAGQSSREERNTDTADCKDDDRPTNDNPDEEGEGSFSNKSSFGHKQVISTADLDEMMDMGIVDQIDQEAQMKEEEQKNMDVEGSQSPSNSSKGTRKQISELFTFFTF